MIRSNARGLRPAIALLAAAALVAGCSSAESGENDNDAGDRTYEEGMVGAADQGGDPVQGGTLSMSAFAEPRSLDPAVTIAAGSTGGTEMAAIYDTLLRYDTESQEFVPQMAESVEANEDYTEFTLTLRDGVTFSDGSPLDSAAVKASQERYVERQGPESALWADNVTAIETPDDLTVVYTLDKPWQLFPSILSTGPGMIVGPGADGPGEQFTPVGAGPFLLNKQSPGEDLLLDANPDYWGGRPALDQFRMAYITDQGAAVDSLKSGGLDAVFLRDPDKVDPLLDEELGGYSNLVAGSNMALINASDGRPGADPRVRQAMQMAIDPELVRERVYDGHGIAGSTLFPDYSRWHGETEGLPYDPEAATQLVEEAKADGFDGKIEYMDASDPASRNIALVVEAQLEAVGFEVETNLIRTVGDQVSLIAVERDYDVAGWGLNYREGDPLSKMYATMHSTGTQTYGGYTSPEIDAIIEEFQAATSEDEQREVLDRLQQQVNEDVPYLNWAPFAEVTIWNDDVHGIKGASTSMVLLDQAWKG
jgi:peptide/nickel transport system substrate-binding protein